MPVSLDYILKRNKSNLLKFIKKNRLTSYQLLLEYCEQRKFIPCEKSEYEEAYKKVYTDAKVGSETKDAIKSSKTSRSANRKTSETQKPKKRRYRRKKQQDTSELPDSSDKG